MKLEDVIKKVAENEGVMDVEFDAGTAKCCFIFKGYCECSLDGNQFDIATEDSSGVLHLDDINNYVIEDVSDPEFDQVLLDNGVVKLRLIFV